MWVPRGIAMETGVVARSRGRVTGPSPATIVCRTGTGFESAP